MTKQGDNSQQTVGFDYAEIELRVLATLAAHMFELERDEREYQAGIQNERITESMSSPTITVNIHVNSAEDAFKLAELAKSAAPNISGNPLFGKVLNEAADKVLMSKYVRPNFKSDSTTLHTQMVGRGVRSKSRDAYIFDIDGVIANNEHRLDFIRGIENPVRTVYASAYKIWERVQYRRGYRRGKDGKWRNWQAYFGMMSEDTPIDSTVKLVQSLRRAGNQIVIVTGRPEKYRDVTEQWLRDNDVPFDRLIMRPENNFKPNADLKRELFVDELKDSKLNFIGVFEDNPDAVTMYREYDIPAFLFNSEEKVQ